jgi:N-alpha-acetyltransferase 10/11
MTSSLCLVAPVFKPDGVPAPPPDIDVRASSTDDLSILADLYFEAYDPGIASATIEEAVADIEASFRGDYGEYWFDASPLALREGVPVAAVMTVRRAPWTDVPPCPFVIETFTSRPHRRLGLARLLLAHTMETIAVEGERQLALRVATDNAPALQLYRDLGFVQCAPTG